MTLRRIKTQWRSIAGGLAALAVGALTPLQQARSQTDPIDTGCPATSTPENHTGATLQGYAESSGTGVIYDPVDSEIELQKEGGIFSNTFFPIVGNVQYTCAADFDEDGWMDFAGSDANGMNMGIYINESDANLPATPDWTDPAFTLTPNFKLKGNAYFYTSGTNNGGGGEVACGDFNGDDNQDFAIVLEKGDDKGPAVLGLVFLGNGDGTMQAGYDISTDVPNHFYDIGWDGNMVATDHNGDGRLDLLFGDWTAGGGSVQVFLNDGAAQPRFVPSDYLVQDVGLGAHGVQAIAWKDFTSDGITDLLIGGDSTAVFKLYPGIDGRTVDTAAAQTYATTTPGVAMILAYDFSLDGKNDIIVATNGNTGHVWYYKNDGDSSPFDTGLTQTLSETFSDFDTAFGFDYDNDPAHTPDMMLADGNGAGYSTFANRYTDTYVTCGDIASGTLDLGDLADDEMIVTAAKLTPTMDVPAGTTVTFYLTNVDPPNWQEATACGSDYCVTFANTAGRLVRWKANMCSDSGHTRTPSIEGVQASFDYTPAEEHFRAGVVVDDGVAYVGAFRQPGDRGHFYALNANLDTTYWDAAEKLDAMADADRAMFTAATDGTTRLDFTVANATDAQLRDTLGAATQVQAEEVIAWQRSARFGVIGGVVDPTRLGSVERSTPAVLSPPLAPSYYDFLDGSGKSRADAFIDAQDDRPVLVLFGSKDGALHAVRNAPVSIANPDNGKEAWAFIPGSVAAGFITDKTNSSVTSYVDGAPTLDDVVFADGEIHTVALVGAGNGGRSVFALDVTDTVDRTTGDVTGPDPLWELVPGASDAGLGYTKPSVARVRIAGVERFIAVMGTGLAPENQSSPWTKGRDVIAVDVETGVRLWRFKAACPVTTDFSLFETDDLLEPGAAPVVDGYIDRLVFADRCGFVYKLNPAVELTGSGPADQWLDSTTLGGIATGETDAAGQAVEALFSTELSTGAIGGQRPITGTVGTRPDESGRVILYFGTGGLESFDPSLANEFYAVYADDGSIRGTPIEGTCTDGRCEKFYGGVVVSTDEVFFSRAVDPPVGTETCDLGTARVDGFDADTLLPSESGTSTTTIATASVSPLFGHAGAIYLTTMGGDVVRIGTSTAPNAGDESANGEPSGGASGKFGLLGWRQVY